MWNPFRRHRPRAVPLTLESEPHPDSARADALQRRVDQLLQEREHHRQTAPGAPIQFTRGAHFVFALPYCARDLSATLDLLRWIRDLGKVQGAVVLCSPEGLCAGQADLVTRAAEEAFAEVFPIRTAFDLPREGWPAGTVWSFLHIARFCLKRRWDFWLMEPDCIPLKPGWAAKLRDEYSTCPKPFMGFIERAHPAGDYPRHMTGNGGYNWQVYPHIRADRMDLAWDIAMAPVLTPLCHHTPLFHQEFGPLDRPPTFPSRDDLRRIPEEAVIFHRCKDGSLIRRLREARGL